MSSIAAGATTPLMAAFLGVLLSVSICVLAAAVVLRQFFAARKPLLGCRDRSLFLIGELRGETVPALDIVHCAEQVVECLFGVAAGALENVVSEKGAGSTTVS